jgi:ribosomal protein S18 acetylase RimI-like enzyme
MVHGLLASPFAGPLLLKATDGGTSMTVTLCDNPSAHTLAEHFAAMQPWSRYPFSAKALAAYLALHEAGAPRYAIYSDGQLAGALGLRLNWLRGPYVQFLGVLPAHQRHGIARAVMTQLITDARVNADRNVWVAASSFNAEALRFYEGLGFARVALLDALVQDNIDEVLLRLRI